MHICPNCLNAIIATILLAYDAISMWWQSTRFSLLIQWRERKKERRHGHKQTCGPAEVRSSRSS
jgi:hypothetical protein